MVPASDREALMDGFGKALVPLGLVLLWALLLRGHGPAGADEAVSIVLTDVSASAGLGPVKGDRFSFGDYDADGDPDLLIGGRRLLRNDTEGYGKADATIRFVDVTKASGIGVGPGGSACWVDLDRDGDLDAVTMHGAVKIQEERGRFADASKTWGVSLAKRPTSVGVGDVDGDGYADLLFGGGEKWNDGNAEFFPRVLLRNVEGKRFEDVTGSHDLGEGMYGRAVVFADYDTDGDMDVYLGNYRIMANELLVNEGGRLVNRAEDAGVAGRRTTDRTTLPNGKQVGYHWGHTIAASWADLDADGDLDLWVSNLVHKFAGFTQGQYDERGWICDDSAIYRNDGAPGWGFTDARADSGIPLKPTGDHSVYRGDELWSHAACADLDGDGLPEVFVTQVYQQPYSHSLLFRNLGGLRFEEISGAVGVRRFDSYGGAFADLDGDGDLDLVTNGRPTPKGDREVKVYRNDTAPGPWIAFRLVGPGGDPLPLGAQVLLETGGGRMVRQVDGVMGSHAQQSGGVLRFGLRGRPEVFGAWARWPGGLIQRIDDLEPGRVHEVRSPTGKVPAIRLDTPEADPDGSFGLRARAKRPSLAWIWQLDLDGDGNFETTSKDGRARVKPHGPAEVRVRLWRRSWGLGREALWRLDPAK